MHVYIVAFQIRAALKIFLKVLYGSETGLKLKPIHIPAELVCPSLVTIARISNTLQNRPIFMIFKTYGITI